MTKPTSQPELLPPLGYYDRAKVIVDAIWNRRNIDGYACDISDVAKALYAESRAPQPTDTCAAGVELSAAAHALIGYTESLTVDLGITQGYIDRLHNHYIPQLKAALRQPKTEE